jgi:hypothetical protein
MIINKNEREELRRRYKIIVFKILVMGFKLEILYLIKILMIIINLEQSINNRNNLKQIYK